MNHELIAQYVGQARIVRAATVVMEALRDKVVEHMAAEKIEQYRDPALGTVTVMVKKTYTFPADVVDGEAVIARRKKDAIASGEAKAKESRFIRYQDIQ